MILALLAGIISGIVVDETTGSGVRKAEVTLTAGRQGQSTMTDAEGRFKFEALPPGRYSIQVSKTGYEFIEGRGTASKSSLDLAQGGNQDGLRYVLRPLGLVTGRVVDADGDPVVGARLLLLRQGRRGGKVTWLPGPASASSDDRGEFRMFGIQSGRYVLACAAAGGRPGLIVRTDRSGPVTVFYPDALEPDQAQILDVKAGSRLEGLTVKSRTAPQFVIRGKVTGLAGEQGMGVHVMVEQASWARYLGSGRGASMMRDGNEFTAGPLPPGNYTLFAQQVRMGPAVEGGRRVSEQLTGVTQVSVSDRDVDGVTIQLGPGTMVEGSVAVEGEKEVVYKGLYLMAQSSEESGYAQGGEARQDGSFQFNVARPGKYVLRPMAQWGARYLASIRVGGEEMLGREIDLSYGSPGPVRVVYRKDGGSVEGTVRAGEGPPGVATAVLWPVEERFRPFPYLLVTPVAETGAFSFKNVAPGEYVVLALPRVDRGILNEGIDLDKDTLDQGAKVKVVAGSGSTVEIPLVQRPEENK